jgi:hypothetical protein
MINLRDALNVALGVTVILAMPTMFLCGVIIFVSWVAKALGL